MNPQAHQTVSVILATFNGARFLRPQLASLAAQSLPPCELLVCDDGSTDDTLAIAREFQDTAPFPVTVHRNPSRLGYADNFLHGSARARGDLIAFCDQDDVWQPDKLARCVAALAGPDTLLAIHSATVVDDELRPRGFDKPAFATSHTVPPGGGPLDFTLPGFAMVFSARLVRLVDWRDRVRDQMKADQPRMAHDQWITFLARNLGNVALLADHLALYRQHGGNTCGAAAGRTPLPTLDRAANQGAYHQRSRASAAYSRFLKDLTGSLPAPWRAAAEASARHYHRQAENYASRARLYLPGRSFAGRINAYAELWQTGAYRSQGTHGLGWRAGLKDAFSVVVPESALPPRPAP